MSKAGGERQAVGSSSQLRISGEGADLVKMQGWEESSGTFPPVLTPGISRARAQDGYRGELSGPPLGAHAVPGPCVASNAPPKCHPGRCHACAWGMFPNKAAFGGALCVPGALLSALHTFPPDTPRSLHCNENRTINAPKLHSQAESGPD